MFSFWKQPQDASTSSPRLSKDDVERMTRLPKEPALESTEQPALQIWKQSTESETCENDDQQNEIDRMYQQVLDTIDTVEQETGIVSTDVDETVQEDAPFVVASSEEQIATEEESQQKPDRITPNQILEAALFVGGTSLTTKKLRHLLQDEFDNDFIESAITQLNETYQAENRPYEITFGEGGYRMQLRQKYERVRIRTFGMGPKEVKLSQDALEILAVVAYKQPITKKEIDILSKKKTSGALRQLLRHELITLERNAENSKEVRYHTSPRFLQLFGLDDIVELPTAEDIEFK